MKVWVYTICKNEVKMMPYFLRHYETFCDSIIIYDDKSDDGTRDVIKKCSKAQCRDWPGTHNELRDDEFIDFAHEQWKEARGKADWVIWVDADEFIYHPNIHQVLERYLAEGVDVPFITGYVMVSDHFPTTNGQIYDEIKTGFRSDEWSKPVVFRKWIRWCVGRHSLDIGSDFNPVRSSDAVIKLLHYRYLGLDYVKARNTGNRYRQPDYTKRQTWGWNNELDAVGNYTLSWYVQKHYPPLIEVV